MEDGFAGALAETARTCPDVGALRQATLGRIAELLPFDSAMFISARIAEAPASVNKDGFRQLYWNYARDPGRYKRGLARGVQAAQALGGAYLDTEVFTAAERSNLPLYAEMIRPQGIASQIVARPTFRGRSTGMVYLCRHGTGRFARGELERMVRLLPIIALSHAALDALARPPAAARPLVHADRRSALTPREDEVVELVFRGLTNGEIAAVLGTRPTTVRNQLVSIFRKLEVASRAELAGLIGAGRAEPTA